MNLRLNLAVALALGLATVGASASNSSSSSTTNPGLCQNTCQGACLVTGDPHITPFDGPTFHTPPASTSAVLYSLDGFAIQGPITTVTDGSGGQFHVFYELSFGSTLLKASTLCPNNTTKGNPHVQLKHAFGTKGYVWLDVWCATSSQKSKLLGAFLNFKIDKVDFSADAEATFWTLEDGASGYCFGPDGARRRSLRALSSTPAPSCAVNCMAEAPCTAVGDPHITTFFDQYYSITNADPQTFTLYEMPGTNSFDKQKFVVTIETANTGRIQQVSFGGAVISTANCTNGKNTVPLGLRETFTDGDVLQIVVQCTTGKHDNEPVFLDVVSLDKYDVLPSGSSASDFKSMEQEQDTSGLCILPPAA